MLTRLAVIAVVTSCASSPPPLPPAAKPAPPSAQPANRAERRAIKLRALSAYEAKDWAACGPLFEQAGDHYDAACCRAQAGERDAAFTELARAIDTDFRDRKHLEADTDLASLHDDPRWAKELAHIDAATAAYHRTVN